jgi:uncharacterized protein (TIGR02646 family)
VIKIDKPKLAPKKLREDGKKKKRANCISYTRNRKKYDNGKKKFAFDSGIYGHKTVKQALIKAQHDKCCFCESKITHISYGDVEHFRPKAAVRQKSKDPLERPGYYWLAYEWSNLFLSCQLCNQRYKENLFPLKDPGKRAKSHKDNVKVEEQMFISPEEEPEEMIAFREEIVYAIDDNPRGKATIKALGLNRGKLADMRKNHFDTLKVLYEIANLNPPINQSKNARKIISKAIQNSSQYASMIRCGVNGGFKTIGESHLS